MSPRAAWQLEALGFEDVYDFVPGKVEWIIEGLPLEGFGPHYPLVGEIADPRDVVACHLGDNVGDMVGKIAPDAYCVVLNDEGVVLGRMRHKTVADNSGDALVESVMEPGPTTVRPTEPADALLKRMEAKKVPAVLVTTSKGKLVGAVTRDKLESFVTHADERVTPSS